MAKQDGRRRSEAAKAKTRSARIARASARRRVSTWSNAASAAAAVGNPLNVALHLTWSALLGGDRRSGHILGLSPIERERRFWSDLRMVAARAEVPWLAMRGPEYDRQRGLHLHVALHLPTVDALRDALNVVERLTGAPAEWIATEGRTVRGLGRQHRGVVARSACGGWFMQRHLGETSSNALAAYAAKGDGKAAVEGQHRLSNALVAITRQAAENQTGIQ